MKVCKVIDNTDLVKASIKNKEDNHLLTVMLVMPTKKRGGDVSVAAGVAELHCLLLVACRAIFFTLKKIMSEPLTDTIWKRMVNGRLTRLEGVDLKSICHPS
jgi:hypothetical protein